jgi:hypothetical protein
MRSRTSRDALVPMSALATKTIAHPAPTGGSTEHDQGAEESNARCMAQGLCRSLGGHHFAAADCRAHEEGIEQWPGHTGEHLHAHAATRQAMSTHGVAPMARNNRSRANAALLRNGAHRDHCRR